MKLFAIYGNPVAHSKSPQIHNSAFTALGMPDCVYTRIRLESGEGLVAHFKAARLSGANVTVPFKEDAFAQCDEVHGPANEIKAVNTLVLEGEKVIGYNTDGDGFMASIREFGPIKKALILGAGGTAKAIAVVMKHAGIECHILNRSDKRLSFFKELGIGTSTWHNFDGHGFEMIVNTTSAGLEDDELPAPVDLLNGLLSEAKYAYDVIYNKETPFLSFAMKHGLIMKDGKDMLVCQAVYAFMKFTGRKDFDAVKKIMDRAIEL